jgi:hypothetical protein
VISAIAIDVWPRPSVADWDAQGELIQHSEFLQGVR